MLSRGAAGIGFSLALVSILQPFLGGVGAADVVKVLAIGSVSPEQSPVPDWLSSDPGFEASLIPTRLYDVSAMTPDQARRMLRIYFPRTEGELGAYDCLLFSGGDVRFFSPMKIEMMKKAVQSGTGAATDMGGMSVPLHDSWIASGIWEIFPNDVVGVQRLWEQGLPKDMPFRIVINKGLGHNPLLPFVSLGIERILGGRSRVILPEPGAIVYAWMKSESLASAKLGLEPAAAALWSYGSGRALAMEGWLGHSWWSSIIDPSENPYGQDILTNYLLDISARPYLADITLAHEVRRSFSDFDDHLSYITSLFDFVERFGANTNALNQGLDEAEEVSDEARSQYLDGDLEGALGRSQQSIRLLMDLRKRAAKLRSRALQWVYLIEWLAITATLMVIGFLLDQVMVRRKLYRRVSSTRGSADRRRPS